MIVQTKNVSRQSTSTPVLTARATRTLLEQLEAKPFNQDSVPEVPLDRKETARFIADRLRFLRLAAVKTDLRSVAWLIENSYYEAYLQAVRNNTGSVEFSKPPSAV